MKKTKNENEVIEKETNEQKDIQQEPKQEKIQKAYKVKFHNTYIGSYGIYYKDTIYEVSKEIFEILKGDCGEI